MKLRSASILAALAVASCASATPAPPIAATPSRPQPPQVEMLPPASLRLVQDASISERHYAIGGVDLPAEGLDITLTCRINRERGNPYICLPPDNGPLLNLREVATADRRISQMRYDTSLLEPGKKTTAVTNITVHLSPKDRRVLAPPAQVRPASDARWERQPNEDAIEGALWTVWRRGIETNHLEARMRCEIQTDLSVICADVRVIPDNVSPSQLNALILGTYYRSEARLADGSPAAGAWIEINVAADEPPILVAPAPRRP
jgi:hypothetical protein